MPKVVHLTARAISALREPGRHAVGKGVYLHIADDGTRQFWARGTVEGKRRWTVLGDAATLTVSEAAAIASGAIAKAATPKQAPAHVRTFKGAYTAFCEARQGSWKHKAHRAQWDRSLELIPTLHAIPVDKINARDVAAALIPLQDRAETLQRTRGRIEQVVDAEMIGAGIMDRANPATLRVQSHLVPGLSKAQRKKARQAIEHHAAMTFAQTRELWPRILDTVAGRALRLAILAGCRTNEIRQLRWRDWNPETRVLTITAENSKIDMRHDIPLPVAALSVIGTPGAPDAHIFTKSLAGKPLSQDTMRMALRRLGVTPEQGTVHGFRSTMRDWARDNGHDENLAELALGHKPGNAVVRAYARSDAFDRRAKFMEAWATAVTTPTGTNVTPIRKAGT
jgi:integrase